MTAIMLAIVTGVLFTCGALLLLQRGQIKVVLGLALFTHAVNLALFGSGALTHGKPPIVPHEGDLAQILATQTFADPLPQALILTAIVISFGVTAFLVVLVSRRDAFTGGDLAPGELALVLSSADPFSHPEDGGDSAGHEHADDYDIFQYEFDEVYDRPEAAATFGHEELPGARLDS
jgi:multisubunit Na+/H+ antiporter MnhC subunit